MTRRLTGTGLVRFGALASVVQNDSGAAVIVIGDLSADELRHVAKLAHEAAVNAERRAKSVLPAVVSPAGC